MTEEKREVPAERQLDEDQDQNPKDHQGEPMTSSVPTPLEFRPEFDLRNKAGRLITVTTKHVQHLGRQIVAVRGINVRINLEAPDARDLAEALNAIASLIDGQHAEEGTEIRRPAGTDDALRHIDDGHLL